MAIRGLSNRGGIFAQNAQGSEDMESADIAKQFDGAISKVQNAPRKAQKKIPPDTIPKLQADKANSVRNTENAKKEEERAQAEAGNDPVVAQVLGGQGDEKRLVESLGANFGGQQPSLLSSPIKNVSMIKGGDDMATRGIGSLGRGSRGTGRALGAPGAAEKDPGKLLAGLRDSQEQQNQLGEQSAELGGQQQQLLERGGMQHKRVNGLQLAGKALDGRVKSHGAKQQAFGEAGKGLGKAGQGLNTAAQVMSSVSQMLNSTAAAVAAIPFVGPALSAALKKAATVVDVVGKVLKTAGQACQKSGAKMNKKSAQEGGLKDLNKAKKVQTEAQKKTAENQRNTTQKQLDKVSDEKRDIRTEKDENVQQQQGIADKLNELGMPVAAPKADRGRGGDDRPQIVKNNQKGAAPARPSQAPASGGVPTPGAAPVTGGKTAPKAPGREEKTAAEPIPTTGPEVKGPQSQSGAPPTQPGSSKTAGQPQQTPVLGAKAPLSGIKNGEKAGQKARGLREEEEGPQVGTGSGNGKRQRFEAELKRLSEAVQQGKSGSGQGQHGLRDKQRQLATMYNQAAAEDVSVDEQVEKRASEALQNSPERPNRKLRTVSGIEDIGDGGNAQQQPGGRRQAEKDGKTPSLRGPLPPARLGTNAAAPAAPIGSQVPVSQPVVAA